MAFAKESYLSAKINGRKEKSYHIACPSKWLKSKDKNICVGIIFCDLTKESDRETYEKIRLSLNWG